MIFCRKKQRTNANICRTKVAGWQDVGVEKFTPLLVSKWESTTKNRSNFEDRFLRGQSSYSRRLVSQALFIRFTISWASSVVFGHNFVSSAYLKFAYMYVSFDVKPSSSILESLNISSVYTLNRCSDSRQPCLTLLFIPNTESKVTESTADIILTIDEQSTFVSLP